jgi:AraC-like DNA-binding protein
MRTRLPVEQVKVWRVPHLKSIELHRGIAVHGDRPRHWHEEFHLCAIEGGGGALSYRGAEHVTPTQCLFIVHPGEVHSNHAYPSGCSYRNLYVTADFLENISGEISRQKSIPFFPEPVLFEATVIEIYSRLHRALEDSASRLEQESLLLTLFVHLITRHSADRASLKKVSREREAVKKAREYLIEHFDENISLEQMARLVGMTPFYFTRVFSMELGLPPHSFQTQLRILRAKSLLHQGWRISEIAQSTGFADQSHLNRHFKRVTGVTPGAYAKALSVFSS